MQKFLLFIMLLFLMFDVYAKSPHGANFNLNCKQCHTTEKWSEINYSSFNHAKTRFPLVGQHKNISCKKCHPTLEFTNTKTECSDCHVDIHQGTVGRDCERCHSPKSWIVQNVKRIHQQNGFALIGAHATADCNRCHSSASLLRFENIRTECYSCHKAQYDGTNHRSDGFDTDCSKCHTMTGQTWSSIGKGFDHGFYPLVGGHNVDCIQCHVNGEYRTKLSTDCKICHITEYARAKALLPAHFNNSKIGKYACFDCHNIQNWNSVKFKQHDSWFEIYSGKHNGAWSKCTDCHNNDASYQSNCKKCHD